VIIQRYEIVVAFDVEENIVLSCGPFLKKLQTDLGGRVFMINAPDDAPPPLARVVLKLEDCILNVGLDRFYITAIPPSHVAQDAKKSSNYARQRIFSMISELMPAVSAYRWSGIIAELDFPEDPLRNKSALEAAVPVFDRVMKIDRRNRKLGSLEIRFGFRDDQYFVNYMVTTFERRSIKLPKPPKRGVFAVELSEHPLTACGIEILVDVNNKPACSGGDPNKDIELILDKHMELYENLPKEVGLEGML
jgi:hypothetical protein